jgi:branched-subunit amino acid ABC-type transport system permease component
MGSVPGAFVAALIIGQLQAFGILIFPKVTLVHARDLERAAQPREAGAEEKGQGEEPGLVDAERADYELVLIAVGPLVLGLLWLLMHRTRFGVLIRAATRRRGAARARGGRRCRPGPRP